MHGFVPSHYCTPLKDPSNDLFRDPNGDCMQT